MCFQGNLLVSPRQAQPWMLLCSTDGAATSELSKQLLHNSTGQPASIPSSVRIQLLSESILTQLYSTHPADAAMANC